MTPISILKRCMPRLGGQIRNFRTLAIEYGQWRSIKQQAAVDAVASPIPWYTYPAIEYLASFDFQDKTVFEFGSGNSSKYWASRAQSVISVEDDKAWYEQVSNEKSANQTILHHADEQGYAQALPAQGRQFDIIIIDGKWRMSCTKAAVNHLKEGGLIILDNSDRAGEKECSAFLRQQGFYQIDFTGFGPINNYCWSTSIFIKAATSMQNGFDGPNPICGLGN